MLLSGCAQQTSPAEEVSGSAAASETPAPGEEAVMPTAAQGKSAALTVAVSEISKHGNVKPDISFEQMNAAELEIGGIITVTAGENVWNMPIGTFFSDSGREIRRSIIYKTERIPYTKIKQQLTACHQFQRLRSRQQTCCKT